MVAKREIEVGTTYGCLTVLHEDPSNTGKLLLRCSCGREVSMVKGSVRSGNSTSCGCKRKETLVRMLTTHGKAARGRKHPLYGIWSDMHRRCTDKKRVGYVNYGGRGIAVCQRWNDFNCFLLDMGDRPGDKFSIDRIDVNGDYCPENCRWATDYEQVVNQRKSLRYVYKDVQYTLKELAVESGKFGVSYSTLRSRIATGVAVALAVETPKSRTGRPKSSRFVRNREGVVNYYPVGC